MVLQDDDNGQSYADIFNCKLGDWPIKYLGVPACGSRLHVAEEKIVKSVGLVSWKPVPW